MTEKVEILPEANQTLLFKRLQNNFFVSRPLEGANITQIFPFTKTTKPHEIQLVPNIWSTSFHQPVKISIDSFAAVASFQLVPKYISKVKVLSKYFTLKHCFLGKWWQRDKVPNCSYLMGYTHSAMREQRRAWSLERGGFTEKLRADSEKRASGGRLLSDSTLSRWDMESRSEYKNENLE